MESLTSATPVIADSFALSCVFSFLPPTKAHQCQALNRQTYSRAFLFPPSAPITSDEEMFSYFLGENERIMAIEGWPLDQNDAHDFSLRDFRLISWHEGRAYYNGFPWREAAGEGWYGFSAYCASRR